MLLLHVHGVEVFWSLSRVTYYHPNSKTVLIFSKGEGILIFHDSVTDSVFFVGNGIINHAMQLGCTRFNIIQLLEVLSDLIAKSIIIQLEMD